MYKLANKGNGPNLTDKQRAYYREHYGDKFNGTFDKVEDFKKFVKVVYGKSCPIDNDTICNFFVKTLLNRDETNGYVRKTNVTIHECLEQAKKVPGGVSYNISGENEFVINSIETNMLAKNCEIKALKTDFFKSLLESENASQGVEDLNMAIADSGIESQPFFKTVFRSEKGKPITPFTMPIIDQSDEEFHDALEEEVVEEEVVEGVEGVEGVGVGGKRTNRRKTQRRRKGRGKPKTQKRSRKKKYIVKRGS